jgi:hypothetical protein
MKKIFDLEPKTNIPRDKSYIISYPYFVSFFRNKDSFSEIDVVCGAHMIYGWMPTILDLYPSKSALSLSAAALLLTRVKQGILLKDQEIKQLACLINNSLVGASKLLHFVAPENYAIWDSKICEYYLKQKAYAYRVNDVSIYKSYLSELLTLKTDVRFRSFHQSVNNKMGYPVSPLRAMEVIMFINS